LQGCRVFRCGRTVPSWIGLGTFRVGEV